MVSSGADVATVEDRDAELLRLSVYPPKPGCTVVGLESQHLELTVILSGKVSSKPTSMWTSDKTKPNQKMDNIPLVRTEICLKDPATLNIKTAITSLRAVLDTFVMIPIDCHFEFQWLFLNLFSPEDCGITKGGTHREPPLTMTCWTFLFWVAALHIIFGK